MQKLLSIAVPSYNSEKDLEKCIHSLLDEKTLPYIEVLIVNDGSKDRTAEIADSFEKKYPLSIRAIHKENGGHGSAINRGIVEATGKYFAVLDSDDFYEKENFLAFIDLLKSYDVDMVVANMKSVYNTGEIIGGIMPEEIKTDMVYSFDNICANNDYIDLFILSRVYIKTEILKKHNIRLPEKTYYVDFEYIACSTCFVNTIVFTDLNIYRYMLGNINQSVSETSFVKNRLHHQRVALELIDFYNNNDFAPEIIQYLKNKILRIVKFHYSILLIYNKNKKEALLDAEAFRMKLKEKNEEIFTLCEKRYSTLRTLAKFGMDHKTLENIKKPLKRIMGRK